VYSVEEIQAIQIQYDEYKEELAQANKLFEQKNNQIQNTIYVYGGMIRKRAV